MRVRITFAKQDALRYTGHLDLHKIWERAARRAALPLAYSRGFHPQSKISLASALPLGFSSRAEMLDMKLDVDVSPNEIGARLKDALPSGIQVLNVERVDEHAPALQTQVTAAEYEATLTLTEAIQETDLKRRIEELMRAESLPRQRRGKSYDLRPLIEEFSLAPNPSPGGRGELCIFMRLTARQGATGRPEEVLEALGIPLETTRIERTRLIFC